MLTDINKYSLLKYLVNSLRLKVEVQRNSLVLYLARGTATENVPSLNGGTTVSVH